MTIFNKGDAFNVSPDSIVFALDLHKVLIRPNIKEMMQLMLLHKSLFIGLFYPRIWYHIIKDGALSEEKVDHIVEKYKTKGVTKELLMQLVNCQYMNKSTINLFQKLKNEGYALYLASDIWQHLLYGLQKKFSFMNTLFKGYYIPSEQNGYSKKPQKKYYQSFNPYLVEHGDANKKVIFIDNNVVNVKAAAQEGFIALQYTNEGALAKDLKQLGFKLP